MTTRQRLAAVAVALAAFGGIGAGAGAFLQWGRAPATPASASASARPPADERCDLHGWCRPPRLGSEDPLHGGDTIASVWAAAPDDVHAVGLSGTAYHFDGVRWSARPSGERILRHVHGVAADAVWLVGDRAALLWDGQRLQRHSVPVNGELESVHAIARDDVWAVSTTGETAHFDGSFWSRVATPRIGWLLAVWGAKRDDVWAAGGGDDGTNSGRVLHWDGSVWTPVPLPRWTNIEGLSGTAPDDVWAAGSWGTLMHWDGRRWTELPSPATRGLFAVWARARDDAWAVGEDAIVVHFDGRAWTAYKPDWPSLRGVGGTASGEVFAVGVHGLVLHWRGGVLAPAAPPQRPRPFTIAGRPGEPPPPSSPPSPPTSPTGEPPAGSTEDDAGLSRARKLLAEGQLEAANQAFLAASGEGQTVHARPIVERAHMLLTRGEGSSVSFTPEEVVAGLAAGTRDGDPELEAQAWYNLALLHARRGEAEAERAALARSLLRREQPSVRAKLGARSPCTAELGTPDEPRVVTGWAGVCSALGRCAEGEAVTPAAARARSCVTSSLSATVPDESHGCAGDGPWDSSFGYSPHSLERAFIAPAGGERFFVDRLRVGNWLATCRGETTVRWEQTERLAVRRLTVDALAPVPGRPTPQADGDAGACLELPTEQRTAVFAVSTGKPLAAVTVIQHHGVEVTVDAAHSRLQLAGGGCDGWSVPLDGSPRLIRE